MMLNSVDLSAYGYARHFKFLKDSRIVLPELRISKNYEAICEKIYCEISRNIFQNRRLSDLRDWVAPLVLNGQISLSN
jgi:type I restriction enzyme S subunit